MTIKRQAQDNLEGPYRKSTRGNDWMEEEYRNIIESCKKNPPPCKVGANKDNKHKNRLVKSVVAFSDKVRYFDVLPTDETRVKLEDVVDDYINASFINGETSGSYREYIACQAPLRSTRGDFWRMVWQQCSGVVVMLTPLEENGVIKCDQYWPEVNGTKKYGDFLIHNRKTFNVGPNIIRSLVMKPLADDIRPREVIHLEFRGWVDHGTVEDAKTIVNLANLTRRLRERVATANNVSGPMVVHCSAGVGRTGTFIACDIALQRAKQRMSVDVQRTVRLLRWQRPKSVMTAGQYGMIYAVAQAATRTEVTMCAMTEQTVMNSEVPAMAV